MQRVSEARVRVDDQVVGEIGRGLCVLLGVTRDDEPAAERLAGKVARLRIFENEEGKFDHSVQDVEGAVLVVSQFTLIADSRPQRNSPGLLQGSTTRGMRSHCTSGSALRSERLGVRVETGLFGARMAVELVNDGPVTIILTSEPWLR